MHRITNLLVLSFPLLLLISCKETTLEESINTENLNSDTIGTVTFEEFDTPPFYLLSDTTVEFNMEAIRFDPTYKPRSARTFGDIVDVHSEPFGKGVLLGAIPFNEPVEVVGKISGSENWLFVKNRVVSGFVHEKDISLDTVYTDFLIGYHASKNGHVGIKTFSKNARHIVIDSIYRYESCDYQFDVVKHSNLFNSLRIISYQQSNCSCPGGHFTYYYSLDSLYKLHYIGNGHEFGEMGYEELKHLTFPSKNRKPLKIKEIPDNQIIVIEDIYNEMEMKNDYDIAIDENGSYIYSRQRDSIMYFQWDGDTLIQIAQ